MVDHMNEQSNIIRCASTALPEGMFAANARRSKGSTNALLKVTGTNPTPPRVSELRPYSGSWELSVPEMVR
ncbi:hypothetical protein ES705_17294 [subsurface metagenome]